METSCSTCRESQRAQFSKNQLAKGPLRRCKACVGGSTPAALFGETRAAAAAAAAPEPEPSPLALSRSQTRGAPTRPELLPAADECQRYLDKFAVLPPERQCRSCGQRSEFSPARWKTQKKGTRCSECGIKPQVALKMRRFEEHIDSTLGRCQGETSHLEHMMYCLSCLREDVQKLEALVTQHEMHPSTTGQTCVRFSQDLILTVLGGMQNMMREDMEWSTSGRPLLGLPKTDHHAGCFSFTKLGNNPDYNVCECFRCPTCSRVFKHSGAGEAHARSAGHAGFLTKEQKRKTKAPNTTRAAARRNSAAARVQEIEEWEREQREQKEQREQRETRNPMTQPRITKVSVTIGVGGGGEQSVRQTKSSMSVDAAAFSPGGT